MKFNSKSFQEKENTMKDFAIHKIFQIIEPICKTERQRVFFCAYAVRVSSTGGMNAAECARLAGYSPHTARIIASQLLSDPQARVLAYEARYWYRRRYEWLEACEENWQEFVEFRTRPFAKYFDCAETRVQFFCLAVDDRI